MQKIAVVLFVFASGCASTAVIRSNPSGASVRLNGNIVGRTPYTQTDTDPVFSATKNFTLELPGYHPTTVTASKSDWGNGKTAGFAIGGLFFWPLWGGLFWAPDYVQVPEVQLEPIVPPAIVAPPPAPPPALNRT